jgi:uncharacterized SAM-binding protein YcdF (DUF218 family)
LRTAFRRRVLPVSLLVCLAGAGVLWIAREPLLTATGEALIRSDQPFAADIIVVLGGGWDGNRILRAGELVRQGYARQVLVSGPDSLYDTSEDLLSIPFAVKRGYPASYFAGFPLHADSTYDEALALVPELRRRGSRRVIVVTSDYHTRRAGRIWRSVAPDMDIRMVASLDSNFRSSSWWRSRQGLKVFFYESVKSISSLLGV